MISKGDRRRLDDAVRNFRTASQALEAAGDTSALSAVSDAARAVTSTGLVDELNRPLGVLAAVDELNRPLGVMGAVDELNCPLGLASSIESLGGSVGMSRALDTLDGKVGFGAAGKELGSRMGGSTLAELASRLRLADPFRTAADSTIEGGALAESDMGAGTRIRRPTARNAELARSVLEDGDRLIAVQPVDGARTVEREAIISAANSQAEAVQLQARNLELMRRLVEQQAETVAAEDAHRREMAAINRRRHRSTIVWSVLAALGGALASELMRLIG